MASRLLNYAPGHFEHAKINAQARSQFALVRREDKANLVKHGITVVVIILGTFVARGWYIYKLMLKMYEESKAYWISTPERLTNMVVGKAVNADNWALALGTDATVYVWMVVSSMYKPVAFWKKKSEAEAEAAKVEVDAVEEVEVELLEDEELTELLDLKVDYDKIMVVPLVKDRDTLLEMEAGDEGMMNYAWTILWSWWSFE